MRHVLVVIAIVTSGCIAAPSGTMTILDGVLYPYETTLALDGPGGWHVVTSTAATRGHLTLDAAWSTETSPLHAVVVGDGVRPVLARPATRPPGADDWDDYAARGAFSLAGGEYLVVVWSNQTTAGKLRALWTNETEIAITTGSSSDAQSDFGSFSAPSALLPQRHSRVWTVGDAEVTIFVAAELRLLGEGAFSVSDSTGRREFAYRDVHAQGTTLYATARGPARIEADGVVTGESALHVLSAQLPASVPAGHWWTDRARGQH